MLKKTTLATPPPNLTGTRAADREVVYPALDRAWRSLPAVLAAVNAGRGWWSRWGGVRLRASLARLVGAGLADVAHGSEGLDEWYRVATPESYLAPDAVDVDVHVLLAAAKGLRDVLARTTPADLVTLVGFPAAARLRDLVRVLPDPMPVGPRHPGTGREVWNFRGHGWATFGMLAGGDHFIVHPDEWELAPAPELVHPPYPVLRKLTRDEAETLHQCGVGCGEVNAVRVGPGGPYHVRDHAPVLPVTLVPSDA
jgi:hypothetical protein